MTEEEGNELSQRVQQEEAQRLSLIHTLKQFDPYELILENANLFNMYEREYAKYRVRANRAYQSRLERAMRNNQT